MFPEKLILYLTGRSKIKRTGNIIFMYGNGENPKAHNITN